MRTLLTIALVGLLTAAAIAAGLTFTTDFENGFDGWTARSLDAVFPWSIELSQSRGFDGTWSAEYYVENFNDAAKVWLEKPFTLTAGKTYDVTISWKLATADGFFGAWSVIAYAGDSQAQQIGEFTNLGSTSNGFEDGQYHWLTKSMTKRVSTTDGSIWVGVGVWGTFEVVHTYDVDSVKVTFTEVKGRH